MAAHGLLMRRQLRVKLDVSMVKRKNKALAYSLKQPQCPGKAPHSIELHLQPQLMFPPVETRDKCPKFKDATSFISRVMS